VSGLNYLGGVIVKKNMLMLVIMAFMVFCCLDTAYATVYKDNAKDFGVGEYPMPYRSPSGYTDYVMSWVEGQEWDLYFVDDCSQVVVKNVGTVEVPQYEVFISPGVTYDKFTSSIKKDTTVNKYYVTDWVLTGEKVSSAGFGLSYSRDFYGTYMSVPWYSFDLKTEGGNVFVVSNPCPPPPLVSTLDLDQVPGMVGGIAKLAIPVGLVLLSMLLLMVLIRYLLRSLLLRTRS
jgi:hypothetical protein